MPSRRIYVIILLFNSSLLLADGKVVETLASFESN